MKSIFKRGVTLLALIFLLLGILPLASHDPGNAEAKVIKKKVYWKTIIKRKKTKLKKPVKQKIIHKKQQKAKRSRKPAYKLPVQMRTIVQKYSLVEALDESEAETIVDELKSLGADDASINIETNTLEVKFNTKKLSAVNIMKKLKELGYTVKSIY